MEGKDKSKKVAKEKRSVKKTKAVALPSEETTAVVQPKKTPVRKSASTGTAKRSVPSRGNKGAQLRADSAPRVLYRRATQELGNPGR